jgi:hypothetical protein
MSGEVLDTWRWCNKCQGLFFFASDVITHGVCPAGGVHDDTGSGNYVPPEPPPPGPGQIDWALCYKCQGLFYMAGGNNSLTVCPAGGLHVRAGDYYLNQLDGQNSWRWCERCQGLFFAGNNTLGVCPSGGAHVDRGSGNYVLTLG